MELESVSPNLCVCPVEDCARLQKKFETEALFRDHWFLHHLKTTSYLVCVLCHHATRDIQNMIYHSRQNHDRELNSETYKVFDQVTNYRYENPGKFRLEGFDDLEVKKDSYKTITVKMGEIVVCPVPECKGTILLNYIDLMDHFANLHTPVAMYLYCSICSYVTKQASNMSQHYIDKHMFPKNKAELITLNVDKKENSNKNYVDPGCYRLYENKIIQLGGGSEVYDEHQAGVVEALKESAESTSSEIIMSEFWQCPVGACEGKIFINKDKINYHWSMVHMPSAVYYYCQLAGCDYSSKRMRDVKRHYNQTHNLTAQDKKLVMNNTPSKLEINKSFIDPGKNQCPSKTVSIPINTAVKLSPQGIAELQAVYKCPVEKCQQVAPDKRFNSVNMERHWQEVHCQEMAYFHCVQCPHQFYKRTEQLKCHYLLVHRMIPEAVKMSIENSASVIRANKSYFDPGNLTLSDAIRVDQTKETVTTR